MATTNYFPKKSDSAPMIYAYEDKYDPTQKGRFWGIIILILVLSYPIVHHFKTLLQSS